MAKDKKDLETYDMFINERVWIDIDGDIHPLSEDQYQVNKRNIEKLKEQQK